LRGRPRSDFSESNAPKAEETAGLATDPWLLGFDFLLILMIAFVVFVLGRGAIQTSIKESKVKYRMVAWLQDLAAAPLAFRCSSRV
jgi:hypothetical protein